jgi:hypothetical protein
MPEVVASRAPAKSTDPQRAAVRPAPRTVRHARPGIDQLQRTLGNAGMSRLLRAGGIQPKLTVGPADDEYEREADRVADDVMRMPDSGRHSQSEATRARDSAHLREVPGRRKAVCGLRKGTRRRPAFSHRDQPEMREVRRG